MATTFKEVFPMIDFDKATRERVTQEWIEATDQATDALAEWRRKLKLWQRQGCDSGEFHAALLTLRSAGLEQWADRNAAGLDALAEAVIYNQPPSEFHATLFSLPGLEDWVDRD